MFFRGIFKGTQLTRRRCTWFKDQRESDGIKVYWNNTTPRLIDLAHSRTRPLYRYVMKDRFQERSHGEVKWSEVSPGRNSHRKEQRGSEGIKVDWNNI